MSLRRWQLFGLIQGRKNQELFESLQQILFAKSNEILISGKWQEKLETESNSVLYKKSRTFVSGLQKFQNQT